MDNIKFYGISLEKISKERQVDMFGTIQTEVEAHKLATGHYPKKVHVYKCWLSMINSNHPRTHLVITM